MQKFFFEMLIGIIYFFKWCANGREANVWLAQWRKHFKETKGWEIG